MWTRTRFLNRFTCIIGWGCTYANNANVKVVRIHLKVTFDYLYYKGPEYLENLSESLGDQLHQAVFCYFFVDLCRTP